MERDITLLPRKEDERPKNETEVMIFSLGEIKHHFEENISYVERQFDVANALLERGAKEAAEDIWRSQIAFLDSAFDFFMHEITKYGLWHIFIGDWDKTPKYNNIKVKMDIISIAIEEGVSENMEWFKNFVNEEYAATPMMGFDIVKDQINLIGLNLQSIADEAFYDKFSREKTKLKLRRRLDELYRRRNMIVHQSDRLNANAKRNEMCRDDVEGFICDIKAIVYAICKEIEKKNRAA